MVDTTALATNGLTNGEDNLRLLDFETKTVIVHTGQCADREDHQATAKIRPSWAAEAHHQQCLPDRAEPPMR
jgi:hypothetical protein